MEGMSFEGFAKAACKLLDGESDKHFRSQYTFVGNESELLSVFSLDSVDEYEELVSSYIKGFKLERRNTSNHACWRELYTEDTAELVYQRYREDFTRYGFNKDSWNETTQ